MYDKVILKNSNEIVDGSIKRPNVSETDYGEIFIGYASSSESIMTKNDSDEIADFCPISGYDESIEAIKNDVFYQRVEPVGKDGDIWVYKDYTDIKSLVYVTTQEKQTVKITNDIGLFDYCYIVDNGSYPDTSVSGALYAEFETPGEHEVRVRFRSGNTSLSKVFYLCDSLCSIPYDLFFESESVTDFSYAFYGCRSIVSIPENMFMNNTLARSFEYAFYGCQFDKLPSMMFFYNSLCENFSNAFESCTRLASIPSDLFVSSSSAVKFDGTFKNCSTLSEIPYNLFYNSQVASSFSETFYGCISLTYVPHSLFRWNQYVSNFGGCFYGCNKITEIPTDMFALNMHVEDFSNCFNGCVSIISSVPVDLDGLPIYERYNKEGYATVQEHSQCFYGCENMKGYDSIPSDWK